MTLPRKLGRLTVTTVALCALAGLAAHGATAAQQSPPDTILYNGKISVLDPANTEVNAIAIRDGKILAAGTKAAIAKLSRRGTILVDLQGRRVVPGLMDGTLHGIRMGAYFCFSRSPRFDALFTRSEAIANVALKASQTPAGKWLFAIGGGWNVAQFRDTPGMLTKAELDAAAPNNPVLLAGGGFTGGQLNTKGLEAMGYTAATPGITLGMDGQPTGQVTGALNTAVQNTIAAELGNMTLAEQVFCTKEFIKEMNRRGLTAWDDPGGNNPYSPTPGSEPVLAGTHGYQAINELHRRGELNARVRFNLSCFGAAASLTIGIPCVTDYITAAVSMVGDDMLRVGGIGEEVMNTTGGIYADPDYKTILDMLARNRWSLQHHIGGAAPQAAQVTSWEAANAINSIHDLNWVMLHPGGGPTDPNIDIFNRLKALNAGVVLTDSGIHGTGGAPPYRRAYDSGVHTCSGTDSLNVAPYPPFINAYYMFSGKGKLGQAGVAADQTLTRLQALRMITSKCDWFMDMEGKIGTLEKGRYADLAVLSGDYFTIPDEDVMTLTSVLTMVGGRTVYSEASAGLAQAKACVVPKTVRTPFQSARRALFDRGCRVGSVKGAYTKKVSRGNVIRQSKRAGLILTLNSHVNLVVSRGARPTGVVRASLGARVR